MMFQGSGWPWKVTNSRDFRSHAENPNEMNGVPLSELSDTETEFTIYYPRAADSAQGRRASRAARISPAGGQKHPPTKTSGTSQREPMA
jgi:hypothetical protein